MQSEYDIVVLGSGIAGSSLALVLGKMGFRVIVVEKNSHPRFAIGESTIPNTNLIFKELGEKYDIPEFCQISSYFGLAKLGLPAWPKSCFYYGVHSEGQPLAANAESMIESLKLPDGPDVHYRRSDVDAYLVSRLASYNVDYIDHTECVRFERSGNASVLKVRTSFEERTIAAKLVVDASGYNSFLARSLNLRHSSPQQATNSRTIFTHAKLANDLEAVLLPSSEFRFQRGSGTAHHCFPGGWLWVIPFDNAESSVGLTIDCERYPLDEGTSPGDEFWSIIKRYPTMAAHLEGMKQTRGWTRTGRIQFTSKAMVGDGFVLAPHSAFFVDPYFSTGICSSIVFVARLSELLRLASERDDYSQEQFRPLEVAHFKELHAIDHMIAGVYGSFRHYELFKVYFRMMFLGAVLDFPIRVLRGSGSCDVLLQGAGYPSYVETVLKMNELLKSEEDPIRLAGTLRDIYNSLEAELVDPATMAFQGEWGTGSQRECSVRISNPAVHFRSALQRHPELATDASKEIIQRIVKSRDASLAECITAYRKSQSTDGPFARAFDKIVGLRDPTFDYAGMLGMH